MLFMVADIEHQLHELAIPPPCTTAAVPTWTKKGIIRISIKMCRNMVSLNSLSCTIPPRTVFWRTGASKRCIKCVDIYTDPFCTYLCPVHVPACKYQARSQAGANGCNCTPPPHTHTPHPARYKVRSAGYISFVISTLLHAYTTICCQNNFTVALFN